MAWPLLRSADTRTGGGTRDYNANLLRVPLSWALGLLRNAHLMVLTHQISECVCRECSCFFSSPSSVKIKLPPTVTFLINLLSPLSVSFQSKIASKINFVFPQVLDTFGSVRVFCVSFISSSSRLGELQR